MQYFNALIIDDIAFSIDMVRLDFTFNANDTTTIERFGNWLLLRHLFNKYTSFRMFNYRDLFVSPCGLKLAIGFNGATNAEKAKGFIEFNPNKQIDLFKTIKPELNKFARNYNIKNYDIAIDIKEHRNNFFILKTQKHYRYYEQYIESIKTHSITEYLGKRNSNGFFKLYNKSVESKLDYDLTRAEITLTDLSYANYVKNMPEVLFVKDINFYTSFSPAIQGLLRLSIEYNDFTQLNYLDYRTREKIKGLMKYKKIDINVETFNHIIYNLKYLKNM